MYGSVIKKFEDKLVEVTTSLKSFTGRLSFHKHEDVLELTPEDKYASKKYGPVFINQNAVLAIREVKPVDKYLPSDCDDDCDCNYDSCEQDKPKGYLKGEVKKSEDDSADDSKAWLNKKEEPTLTTVSQSQFPPGWDNELHQDEMKKEDK